MAAKVAGNFGLEKRPALEQNERHRLLLSREVAGAFATNVFATNAFTACASLTSSEPFSL
jgi:hypothetical protein